MNHLKSYALLIFLQYLLIDACYIHGTDSGVCTTKTLDKVWRFENMPFCGDIVIYPACVPKSHPIPPSKDFPHGRWTNFTVLTKDKWVFDNYELHTNQQIGYETNRTLSRLNQDINGHIGQIVKRFDHNIGCRNSFKNMFCYINFPRCDPLKDLSLTTCKSVCKNFFKACSYTADLERCGKSKYFNGYFPEPPSGGGQYLREYFPGQPWRTNKYTLTKDEIPICTPAIVGASKPNFYIKNQIYTYLIYICISVLVCIFSFT